MLMTHGPYCTPELPPRAQKTNTNPLQSPFPPYKPPGNTSSAWNLDVDKVGAADSLTRLSCMVMVIILIERIKRSRREEVDGGQLKWVVDKSGRLFTPITVTVRYVAGHELHHENSQTMIWGY